MQEYFKNKILLVSIVFLAIAGCFSYASEIRAFVFGSESTVNAWLTSGGIVSLRNEANDVRIGTLPSGTLFVDTSASRVGIATIAPATALDVNGVITATGGISTNWNTAYGWGNHAGLYDLTGTASGLIGTHQSTYNHTLIATAIQTETDPIVGAINGIVKANGAGAISVATAGTDYQLPYFDRTLIAPWVLSPHTAGDSLDMGTGSVLATSFTENGTLLSGKYLGISAKATDSDLLDGHDTSYFATASGFIPYTGATTNIDLGIRTLITTGALGAGAITGTSLKATGLTSGRIPYATTAGLLTDTAGLVFDGQKLILNTQNGTFEPALSLITRYGWNAFEMKVFGDTQPRASFNPLGFNFGSGSAVADVGFRRYAAKQIIFEGGATDVAADLLLYINAKLIFDYGRAYITSNNQYYLDLYAAVGGTGGIRMRAPTILSAGTATAGTAPLKFTSGTSLTTAEAGAMEFTTDDLFFTITTGTARKRLLLADAVGGLTSTRMPYATTNGRLTDSASITTDGTTITAGGLATTGTGTFSGSLIVPYSASAPTLATNGQIATATVSGSDYIYFRSGGSTWKLLGSASFMISPQEKIDALSGDQMEIGDFVIGMIDKNLNDNATPDESSLHGVWVKWDSVKAQLLAEARGELSQTGTWGTGAVEGVETETMLEKVTNVLTSLGISIKDGITTIKQLAVEKLDIGVARIEKMEMVATNGDIYCTWIDDNGDWQKVKGECGSVTVAIAVAQTPAPIPETVLATPEVQTQPSVSTKEIVQQVTEQVAQQVQEQVQQEVAQQLQVQQEEQTPTLTPTQIEQTPAPSEQLAPVEQPTEESKVKPEKEEKIKEEQPSVGDVIQNATAGLLQSIWQFTKWAGQASLQGVVKFIPDGIKSSTASLSSFVIQDAKSDFTQLFSQIKSTLEKVVFSIKNLFAR